FRYELRDYLLRRVGVDLHGACERTYRREGIARIQPAAHNRFLGGEDHLLADGHSGLRSQPERNHRCNIAGVTPEVKYNRPRDGRSVRPATIRGRPQLRVPGGLRGTLPRRETGPLDVVHLSPDERIGTDPYGEPLRHRLAGGGSGISGAPGAG